MNQQIQIRRYGRRNWAVYVGGELLAVTVYKKGALAVAMQIGELMEAASPENEVEDFCPFANQLESCGSNDDYLLEAV